MPVYPEIKIKTAIVEPQTKKARSVETIIRHLKTNESSATVLLDNELLIQKSRDDAFKIFPRLADSSTFDWHKYDPSLSFNRKASNLIDSTPAKMAISLSLRVTTELYSYLELGSIQYPINTPLEQLNELQVESHKEQFKEFLGKRFKGGLVDYNTSGYETYFINLYSLSTQITNYGLTYEREWNALMDLFNRSLLGAFFINWGEKELFSTYFIPIHIPASFISKLDYDAKIVWDLIQNARYGYGF